ncbi:MULTISPECIES: mechanosensitive ion channel family protein [unclassified Colwellia]|uniref:mechanosensitive ion channel family protein n=1 Tax=unclassified Colwellia TaxID=196834 RepID=UPI0015F74179|nr:MULTISPECIES: mechanosensitive ion channel family protein [unclassified Colwellia]MBA6352738.1 mechanosensitive ion channel family protein [Colwellia sp. BRX9-1]MBA6381107.1 mechanosensitive ion channel family protein [Colwellia sp. BRX10-7]MBA6388753.1 mechanosensitive ion channel family protein [Colwellia sp. BRX10-2]MBA6403576.1 mechanosensitive ion channel family protein [Colwellia sp. BRX10-5]MBA6407539.1 mechanosensitive ion channel family protein [Colwellia sp. BRX10-1]|tara:strand:+ start:1681 stop:2553 length:873 start_codon:yes stop_codon:yes gene_type:complete
MEVINEFFNMLKASHLYTLTQALILFVVGYFIAKALSSAMERIVSKKMTTHGVFLLKRTVFYTLLGLFVLSALKHIGIDLTILLGAAGIFTVAIGFASQTSASNLISGIFLMIERPFSIGDVIKVNDILGEVISIDLLSVKLRTFDNLFVRIPNESMIKSAVTTMTKYPIRRADLKLGIAYKEDIEKVRDLLLKIAEKNVICLEEPAPLFILTGFGSSSVDIQFSVWSRRENFLALKNEMYQNIKKTFDEQGIEIPFPHISLYAGSASKPFKVTMNESPRSTADVVSKEE